MVALPRIIVKRWPGAGIDVLVNNAGLGRNNAGLWDGSTASWVEMISTNVLGVCMCTREALKVGSERQTLIYRPVIDRHLTPADVQIVSPSLCLLNFTSQAIWAHCVVISKACNTILCLA